MAGICCGLVGEGEASAPIEPSSRTLKRRKMELVPSFKFMTDVAVPQRAGRPRKRLCSHSSSLRECHGGVESCGAEFSEALRLNLCGKSTCEQQQQQQVEECPKFGVTSVCGRRRDMEDAVSIHPCFSERPTGSNGDCHFYGVFDGHGCSHVSLP